MFLADGVLRNGQRNGCQRLKVGRMDIKIYVLMLLIGFLSVLYHAGSPSESGEHEQA
jgi:hypothetical protein